MEVPANLRYSSDHEWVLTTAPGLVRVGITDYAQDALGDVVFVDLPDVGAAFAGGAMCGEVESTKSVSEVYSPIAGTVTAVNTALVDNPGLLNTDPYGDGWILELQVDDHAVDGLLTAAEYEALTEG